MESSFLSATTQFGQRGGVWLIFAPKNEEGYSTSNNKLTAEEKEAGRYRGRVYRTVVAIIFCSNLTVTMLLCPW